ncbi:primosomal protein [Vibrio vulnificus]|uniref:primosomal protein n=1 Tax=Vibrio vulnificus TaxID=672 RepID=UPI0040584335
MKTVKEKNAQKQIMEILLQLNVIEATNVISAICSSLGQETHNFQKRNNRKTKIELDREVYEFIMGLDLDFIAQKDVLVACVEKFGKERAPSRTGLSRALKKIQNQNTHLR